MPAYVAHCSGAEQSVAESMERHIGIAVPEQSFVVGDIHTTYYTTPPFDKTMYVKSVSDTHHGSAAFSYEVAQTVHVECERKAEGLVER